MIREHKKTDKMKQTISFWLLGISLILLGASLFLNISHTVITNESIVLVFVGILATFIVVGNYAQVKDIENKFMQETNKLREEYSVKVDELNIIKNKFDNTTKDFEKIKNNFEEINAKNNFLLNDAIGSVIELNASMNFDKGFYLNIIHNYINAIRRYDLIKIHKADRDKAIQTLKVFLETIDWNNYDFDDEQEVNIFISDIQGMDFIDINTKNEMIKRLKIINGIKISKQRTANNGS